MTCTHSHCCSILEYIVRTHTRTHTQHTTAPSSSPRSLVGQAVNSQRILLSWDLPEPAGRNGIITGYTIRVLEVVTNNIFTYNLTNRTDFLVDNLHPYYDYQCSIAAVTVAGVGPLSEPLTVRTNESGEYDKMYHEDRNKNQGPIGLAIGPPNLALPHVDMVAHLFSII